MDGCMAKWGRERRERKEKTVERKGVLTDLEKNDFKAADVASSSWVLGGRGVGMPEAELGPARRPKGGNSHLRV